MSFAARLWQISVPSSAISELGDTLGCTLMKAFDEKVKPVLHQSLQLDGYNAAEHQ